MDYCDKSIVLRWAQSPPVPQGTKPLPHQVAGHVFGRDNGHKKNKIGFLQSEDGCVLKPVLGPKKGLREVDFYKRVYDTNCDDDVLLRLRQFMPGYLGVWNTPEHPGLSYLKLEDVTRKFMKPCIMDIKVGPVTYDMEADPEKIKREKSKFPALEEVGFQVVGIKVYLPATDSYKTVERTFLRALDKTTILTQGISQYFTPDSVLEVQLVKAVIEKLRQIEAWFLSQRKYTFIASSLLFTYDGKALHDYKTLKKSSDSTHGHHLHGKVAGNSVENSVSILNGAKIKVDNFYDSIAEVRMIDFTHVFQVNNCHDENYLTGLQSLIRYLNDLVINISESSQISS